MQPHDLAIMSVVEAVSGLLSNTACAFSNLTFTAGIVIESLSNSEG